MPNTADLLVDTLVRWGVDRIYGIPGDGCNGLIEALRLRREDIEFVVVRHEEAAALAASGHAKATGRLGACLATSGPGAIHLLNGLYDAKLDGAPVVSITGQTYSDLQGAHYQQEVNVIALMADVAAYNVQVNGPEHARLATDMACRTAISRRGVAHLSVPIDIQVQTHAEPSPNAVAGTTPPGPIAWRTRPTDDDLQAAANVIAGMRRPLVLAGQGCRGATAELDSLLRRLQAPVSKPLLGKDVLPDDHPHCLGGIGHLGTSASSKAAKECDGLILLGTSFPYVAHLPKPGQAQVVQVDLHPERIGARAPIDVGLVGDVRETLRALLPLVPERKPSGWLRQLREEKQAWEGLLARRADDAGPGERGPLLRPQAAAKAVADILKDNAIICCDTGNVTVWAARHLPMRGDRRFLFSGTL
ncbi:MAG TPA: thiamine pyrophosphate-binding protein, partial [Candidatus Thermoplasmatota archaeon]|nr:thiamine pyrophosphate-binding protein [Candidatus Thermoplasmatota archaeon]